MKTIPCHKCNRNGETSEVCKCDEGSNSLLIDGLYAADELEKLVAAAEQVGNNWDSLSARTVLKNAVKFYRDKGVQQVLCRRQCGIVRRRYHENNPISQHPEQGDLT